MPSLLVVNGGRQNPEFLILLRKNFFFDRDALINTEYEIRFKIDPRILEFLGFRVAMFHLTHLLESWTCAQTRRVQLLSVKCFFFLLYCVSIVFLFMILSLKWWILLISDLILLKFTTKPPFQYNYIYIEILREA